MDLGLKGKKAIITGGSKGIGLASAHALADEGADDGTVTNETTTITAAVSPSLDEDTYVAVMGGGMGSTFVCAGSNVFIVDLENDGRIFGYKENDGPINIVDLEGNEIDNAIPAAPVVITPDLAKGIPWRGAIIRCKSNLTVLGKCVSNLKKALNTV